MESSEHAYAIRGMGCDHCKAVVTDEVEQVAGVAGVDVDLEAGCLTVYGEGFSDAAIHEAVDQAGYEVIS